MVHTSPVVLLHEVSRRPGFFLFLCGWGGARTCRACYHAHGTMGRGEGACPTGSSQTLNTPLLFTFHCLVVSYYSHRQEANKCNLDSEWPGTHLKLGFYSYKERGEQPSSLSCLPHHLFSRHSYLPCFLGLGYVSAFHSGVVALQAQGQLLHKLKEVVSLHTHPPTVTTQDQGHL